MGQNLPQAGAGPAPLGVSSLVAATAAAMSATASSTARPRVVL